MVRDGFAEIVTFEERVCHVITRDTGISGKVTAWALWKEREEVW